MKKSIHSILMSAMLMALPMMLTSCDELIGELDNIGTEDTRVLAAALKEGAVITYTYTKNDVEYTVTFVKEGDKYVLQNQPSTRADDGVETDRYSLATESRSSSKSNNQTKESLINQLNFRVYKNDGAEIAFDFRTNIADGTSTMVRYDGRYGITGMTVNKGSIPEVKKGIDDLNNLDNFKFARFQYTVASEDGGTLIDINISVFQKNVQWKDFIKDHDYFNFTIKDNKILMTTEYKSGEQILTGTFNIYCIPSDASPGDEITPKQVTGDDVVGTPSYDYDLELVSSVESHF